MSKGWVAADLDGTLAKINEEKKYDPFYIGEPIQPMIDRVKGWLDEGKQVWLFTARAFNEDNHHTPDEYQKLMDTISRWCIEHIGQALPITYKKNPSMIELWDDRAVQVIRNEGITPEEKALEDKRLKKEIPRVGIAPLIIDPSRHGKLQLVGSQLMRAVYLFLVSAGQQAAKAAFQKAKELNKLTGDPDEIANAAYSAINWQDLLNNVSPDLGAAVEVGMSDGIAQLELKQDSDYVRKISTEYAEMRSAEMIGKRLVDGKLVDNPGAKYAVSETTRDDLRDIIANAIRTNIPLAELEDSIKMAGIFTNSRARMIAKTELAFAQVRGNLDIWKSSGLVDKVNIRLSEAHTGKDICDSLVAAGPYSIDDVPQIPSHPYCQCSIIVSSLKKRLN